MKNVDMLIHITQYTLHSEFGWSERINELIIDKAYHTLPYNLEKPIFCSYFARFHLYLDEL